MFSNVQSKKGPIGSLTTQWELNAYGLHRRHPLGTSVRKMRTNTGSTQQKTDGECALCKGAKATELVPCCWCTNWVHLRCSYAVPSGRACASHFDVQNPLEKQVVACNDDPLVPEEFRERPVFPNIVIPRYQPNKQAGAKAAMNNMEHYVDLSTRMAWSWTLLSKG